MFPVLVLGSRLWNYSCILLKWSSLIHIHIALAWCNVLVWSVSELIIPGGCYHNWDLLRLCKSGVAPRPILARAGDTFSGAAPSFVTTSAGAIIVNTRFIEMCPLGPHTWTRGLVTTHVGSHHLILCSTFACRRTSFRTFQSLLSFYHSYCIDWDSNKILTSHWVRGKYL